LTLGASPAAAQWGVSAELGVARFGGTSRDSSGATVGPYKPTTLGLRLDRPLGSARVALGVLYAKTGLAAEGRGVAVVQNDIGSLWEIAPELSLRVARLGTGIEARVDAGPTIDFWNFDGERRNRVGARGQPPRACADLARIVGTALERESAERGEPRVAARDHRQGRRHPARSCRVDHHAVVPEARHVHVARGVHRDPDREAEHERQVRYSPHETSDDGARGGDIPVGARRVDGDAVGAMVGDVEVARGIHGDGERIA